MKEYAKMGLKIEDTNGEPGDTVMAGQGAQPHLFNFLIIFENCFNIVDLVHAT